jgi:hypothetical protein
VRGEIEGGADSHGDGLMILEDLEPNNDSKM